MCQGGGGEFRVLLRRHLGPSLSVFNFVLFFSSLCFLNFRHSGALGLIPGSSPEGL